MSPNRPERPDRHWSRDEAGQDEDSNGYDDYDDDQQMDEENNEGAFLTEGERNLIAIQIVSSAHSP